MRFARARGIGLAGLLFGAPGLVRAAPAEGASAPRPEAGPGVEPGVVGVSGGDPNVGQGVEAGESPGSGIGAASTRTGSTADPATVSSRSGEGPENSSAPARRAGERGRTWQIYQRPLPGAEHSWGPPNGQMPAVAEVTEELPDPHRVPPTGTARIAVGAVLGTLGLGVLGLGVAARTTDVLGADHRAGVPLIGAGLVTAAIGWGLFTHGILRRRAYLRWRGAQVSVAPAPAGATLVLRF